MSHVSRLRLRLINTISLRAQFQSTPQIRVCYPGVKPQSQRWHSSAPVPSAAQSNVVTESSPSIAGRKWSTTLAKTIANAIEVTGPITLAAYMRQCLTSDMGGYYTTQHSSADQFGKKGDFVTSPEISQVFGELVGIWYLSEWMAQGRPKEGVQFIELGPGRGTLMSDILRTANQFKAFANSIQEVWMIEAGDGLRQKQSELLCGTSQISEQYEEVNGKKWLWWEATSKPEYGSIKIKWVEDIVLLPPSAQPASTPKTPFIIAHEFFDALPIQAFESVAPNAPDQQTPPLLDKAGTPMHRPSSASKMPQWRELVVTTTTRKLELKDMLRTEAEAERDLAAKSTDDQPDDFRLTLAHASTPASLVLPSRPRYRHLQSQVGARVEISPESARYATAIAALIGGGPATQSGQGRPSGAALVIDYGPADTVPVNSLRGIRGHKIVSPFKHAGQADLSADVDFGGLADGVLEGSDGVEVHGPVEQGLWLEQLGVRERAAKVVKGLQKEIEAGGSNGKTAQELQERIQSFESGWKRLVEGGPRGMGKAYKVMAVLPEGGGKRRPVGFGGAVVG